jgi:hypothetical protein
MRTEHGEIRADHPFGSPDETRLREIAVLADFLRLQWIANGDRRKYLLTLATLEAAVRLARG